MADSFLVWPTYSRDSTSVPVGATSNLDLSATPRTSGRAERRSPGLLVLATPAAPHGDDTREHAEAPGDQEGAPQRHGHYGDQQADLRVRAVLEDEDQSDRGDQNERHDAAETGPGQEGRALLVLLWVCAGRSHGTSPSRWPPASSVLLPHPARDRWCHGTEACGGLTRTRHRGACGAPPHRG